MNFLDIDLQNLVELSALAVLQGKNADESAKWSEQTSHTKARAAGVHITHTRARAPWHVKQGSTSAHIKVLPLQFALQEGERRVAFSRFSSEKRGARPLRKSPSAREAVLVICPVRRPRPKGE